MDKSHQLAVNGSEFNSPVDAAKAFFNPAATSKPFQTLTPYKTKLSNYAQKLGKLLPLYQHTQEGPAHAPQFKTIVTIYGQTFESPEGYHRLRDAEAAAAALALNTLPPIIPQKSPIPSVSYKNILQEMAQKQYIPWTTYNTSAYDSNYSAAFKSFVKIKGLIFVGEPGNSKKQAEMNAAKVACQYFEGSDNK